MRALVVEDEKTPRELLRDLVPWGRHGFDRVDTARNGLEALEVLEAGTVDLVLTDVRMPKMDGVELALEVRRRWPHVVLLFLSGYSDKDYLKTAIRVQALDYLEKPIDLGVVEAAVAEAARTITQHRQSQELSEDHDRAWKDLSPLRRQALALALFGLGPALATGIEDRFAQGPLRVLVVQAIPDPAKTEVLWKSAVLALVNGDGFPYPALVAAPGPGGTLVIACDRTLGADPGAFDAAVEGFLGLIEGLPGVPPVRLGVSPSVPGPGGLASGWSEALQALGEAFYRPQLRIYSVRPASGRTLAVEPSAFESWRRSLEAGDHQAIIRQLVGLEQKTLTARDPDLDRVRGVWLGVMKFLLGFVPAWGAAEQRARLDKLASEFAQAPDLATLARAARDCFERLFVLAPADLQIEDKVSRAKTYIESRFADPDLTVDAVAGHVGYSESYFCTVFKQAEKITVKDFVTRCRIDRAKAYLWEKDPPTLADLALKVGFRDPNYFSTVFKRLTGTSPGAYRKKALG